MNKLVNLLSRASSEELTGLAEILKASSSNIDDILEAFYWNSQSILPYFIGNKPTYKEIVKQVSKKLKVKYKKYETASEIEIKIAQKVMETIWEKMTPEQRIEMEEELRKTAKKFDKIEDLFKVSSMFVALKVAGLSGFKVYLLASTALGATTGFMGITLPFAVYTTMSRAIAVVIGPVGWIGAGLFSVWQLTGPNYKKLTSAILYICALRAKLDGGFL